ncbi:hypothetical protein M2272_003313 [Mycobacterium frederiksbergense]|uniref:Uncharacterized protein n=1 Tax=Mycolicibacterium frederiksbergense TaxID=117567 RepID=A0ABT6L2X8_9MYCO|nr:hypothetical protein [Mycolicibacterium frederiksbergense]
MISNIDFNGVAAAGMPSSVLAVVAAVAFPVAGRYAAPAAPAAAAAWPVAAAIAPQHKRRPAAATGASVDRSHH